MSAMSLSVSVGGISLACQAIVRSIFTAEDIALKGCDLVRVCGFLVTTGTSLDGKYVHGLCTFCEVCRHGCMQELDGLDRYLVTAWDPTTSDPV